MGVGDQPLAGAGGCIVTTGQHAEAVSLDDDAGGPAVPGLGGQEGPAVPGLGGHEGQAVPGLGGQEGQAGSGQEVDQVRRAGAAQVRRGRQDQVRRGRQDQVKRGRQDQVKRVAQVRSPACMPTP